MDFPYRRIGDMSLEKNAVLQGVALNNKKETVKILSGFVLLWDTWAQADSSSKAESDAFENLVEYRENLGNIPSI